MLRIDLAGAEDTIVKQTTEYTIKNIFIFSKILPTKLKEINGSSDNKFTGIAIFYTRDVY